MAQSISKTASAFKSDNLESFTFAEHEVGLLFGNVQAGKTAQMFGIICSAADASFPLFIILTTDNVALQRQTFERVQADLDRCGFCICNERDKQKFIDNALTKPVIIVLKKNSRVLLQWYNTLFASSFVKGNALFVVDDEADAASLNTLVNKKRVSTINRRLMGIRDASIGSMYLQVTGTPQALLLQSSMSAFKPAFMCYFEPGEGYLGGDFFFDYDEKNNTCVNFIDMYSDDITNDGLYLALVHHLVASAQLILSGEKVCNFVIHPGIRKASHNIAREEIKNRIEYLKSTICDEDAVDALKVMYNKTVPENTVQHNFPEIYAKIKDIITGKEMKILVMNGDTNVGEEEYSTGSNIIIGGTVLGRGVTFPKLQTLYYTRTAKKPQADTMWQHSRMFGYDRDPGLMALFITKHLYKLFSNINATNDSIISQAEAGIEKIQLYYPEGINPTRRNVVDLDLTDLIAGGTNYFPDDPDNTDIIKLDAILNQFIEDNYYLVGLKLILQILDYVVPSDDFSLDAFKNVITTKIAENAFEQGVLIVRPGRQVTQGTGSLLSPNDRELGSEFNKSVVLTMYEIKGDLGWRHNRIWVPNIKLPEFINYYDVR
ncbi:Z1 domain-containing protein [Aminicella lysinilytica]|uniref:Z1 domain-containing protein n=2 Tax=Aminicella lysinilytica TaxID=433323 RepID=A0A4V3CQS9_9FIRM|nr:Z1 domain-containing protein [Aminicella lysinilytica]